MKEKLIKQSKIEIAIFIIILVLCISDFVAGYMPRPVGIPLAVIGLIDFLAIRINCKRLYHYEDIPVFVKFFYEPKKSNPRI